MRLSIGFKGFINYLAVFTIFTEAITCRFIGFHAFKIYNFILLFIAILFFITQTEIYFNKIFILLYGLILYLSLYNLILGNTDIFLLSKQLIGILLHSLVFYQLLRLNRNDIKGLFLIYLNIAFIVALIGIIQEIAYVAGVTCLYDFSSVFSNWALTVSGTKLIRVNSIMPEASSFCIVMFPAFFFSLVSYMDDNFRFMSVFRSSVILISYVLTFSIIGYIGILSALFLLACYHLKKRHVILLCLTIVIITPVIFSIIPDYRLRAKDTINALSGKVKLSETNQTTYTFLRNAKVAIDSFKDNIIFGKGVGSHKLSYDTYLEEHNIIKPPGIFLLNAEDANSLFLRLLSETGLIGVIAFLIFILKFYAYKTSDRTNYLWVINNAILILFLLRLIRQGNYISEGFFFFFWLYYFTKKNIVKNQSLEKPSNA